MRIIPVLDLLDGIVVHAVAGKRDHYQPVVSTLCGTAEPLDVATAFRERLGSSELYVADLDGIRGGEPDWGTMESLSARGFNLLLDAGPRVLAGIDRVADLNARLIVASEWMETPQDIGDALGELGRERVIFGLDLHKRKPTVRVSAWESLTPLEIVVRVEKTGVSSVIMLDISNVGTRSGPSPQAKTRCREIVSRFPGVELITGGGIRSQHDLPAFESMGCAAVLVATALHDGRLQV